MTDMEYEYYEEKKIKNRDQGNRKTLRVWSIDTEVAVAKNQLHVIVWVVLDLVGTFSPLFGPKKRAILNIERKKKK